jgi:hypothetical protein
MAKDAKSTDLVKAGRRKSRMEALKIKREIVAILMKSPLYFTVPPQVRLQFVKFFSQPPVFNAISDPQIRQGRPEIRL